MTVLRNGTAVLSPPGRPPHHVPRPRLFARLDREQAPLMVVSAPAGWGKTTLLTSWAAGQRGRARAIAGGDRAGFWQRAMAAVASTTAAETVDAANGQRRLAEALRRGTEPLTLLVDECDQAANPDDLSALAHAVRGTDGRVRLILACRGDPGVALHRWRLDGQLAELSSEDLAFAVDEAADLFTVHGVALPWLTVTELRARAEGWPAGLRLAALTLQRHPEPARNLAGSAAIEAVADYFAAEVLAGLEPQTRLVLAQVSVAEQVTTGLVKALTARADGAGVLADLRRRGAFIMRCRGADDTYRLHAMFSRALYLELGRQDQNLAVRAHRRAAGWYLAQGPPAEALRHLLAAGDWEQAVRVLDCHWADMAVGSRRLNLTGIVSAMPEGEPPPHFWFAMAAERLDAGDIMAVRHLVHLATADDTRRSADTQQRSDAERDSTAYLAWAFRLAAERLAGDLALSGSLATQVLSAPEPAGEPRTSAAAQVRPLALLSLGAVKLQSGHLASAGRHLREARALAQERDMGRVEMCATSHLAAWHAARGQLHEAVRHAGEALELSRRLGLGRPADLGWGSLALAEAYFHWDRLDDAERRADEAVDNSCGDRLLQLWAMIQQARVRTAQGRLEDAHRVLHAARRELVISDMPAPVRRALSLVDGELRLAGSDLAGSRRLLEWQGTDPLPAQAAVLEGSVLLAEGLPRLAGIVVEPYLTERDEAGSCTCRAGAGLVSALAGHELGHRDQTLRGLEVALTVAEEEGLRRCFIAGGHTVRALIESVAPMMLACPPIAGALTATPDPGAASEPERLARSAHGAVPVGSLVEPLTSRELTVLRYLQGTLSHVEISALLYISVNTLKTHVRSIYRKLGASRRKDAIRRGQELHLL